MIDTTRVLGSLQREFPAPKIDSAWIQACAQALSDDGQDPSLANIREQYLFSDLSASTLPSGLIPANAEVHNTHLFPTPTLVQLLSITEIGHSAFQLQTVQEQRKDVLSGVTQIRRMGDEEDEYGDRIDEGKLPAYPRGMLRMEVTDGERVMKALEYKRLDGLKLAETPLGSKNVRTLRGTLLLSPDNTQFLGYEVTHLEAEQPRQFTHSLLRRMDKPIPEEEEAPAPVPARRRVEPPPAAAAAPPARRITMPQSAPAQNVAAAAAARRGAAVAPAVPSPYFQSRPNATAGPSRPARPGPASNRIIEMTEGDDDDFDDVFDDSFIRQLDAVEAKATSTRPKAKAKAQDMSSDYGMDDIDEDILGQLAEVEKALPVRGTGQRNAGSTSSKRDQWENEEQEEYEEARRPPVPARPSSRGASGSSATTGTGPGTVGRKRKTAKVEKEDKENRGGQVIEISD